MLEYAKGMIEHEVVRPIFAKDLRALLGNTSELNTLASWLYANLFIQEHGYFVGGDPCCYKINVDGYRKMVKLFEEATTDPF